MGMRGHKATIIAARIGYVLALGVDIKGFYANTFLIFIVHLSYSERNRKPT